MEKVVRRLKNEAERRRRYFREAEGEISESNLRTLYVFSLAAVVLIFFFLLLTPFLLPAWKPTVYYWTFLVAAFLYLIFIKVYQKKGFHTKRAVTTLCLLFEALLYICMILIDTVSAPGVPSIGMPLLCVALSASFVIPFSLSFGALVFFEAVYVAGVVFVKDPFIGQYDIFASIVALGFAVAVTCRIMALRIRDHEARMKYMLLSTRDPLAQIYNKQACFEAIQKYLRLCNPNVSCALLVLDLDDFKRINDAYGHYTGDAILRHTGEKLREIFRAGDIVGRFGGDEFIVLMAGRFSPAVLEEKCRAVREELREGLGDTVPEPVSCSIGVSFAENRKVEFEMLFRQADDALYKAKNAGKNGQVIHPYKGCG